MLCHLAIEVFLNCLLILINEVIRLDCLMLKNKIFIQNISSYSRALMIKCNDQLLIRKSEIRDIYIEVFINRLLTVNLSFLTNYRYRDQILRSFFKAFEIFFHRS